MGGEEHRLRSYEDRGLDTAKQVQVTLRVLVVRGLLSSLLDLIMCLWTHM